MAKTEHYHTKFSEGRFYHVYNRTVDKKSMFRSNDNYKFFLHKYDHYLSPVIDTYAYCLLGNHFHFLVHVHDLTDFKATANIPANKSTHEIVVLQWRKFFQSYSMAFNKHYQRTGTLFQTPFKRALVDDEQYFSRLVCYIHANPQLHKLTDDFKKWEWSSYGRILNSKPSKLKKREVISWFGDDKGYEDFHRHNDNILIDEKYLLDDMD